MPKKELGEYIYLFTKTANSYAQRLVISAHGGIDKRKQPQFQIKSGTLHFYSVHGHATDDLGIRNFVFGGKATQLVESLDAGKPCYDYSLSKYQGKHALVGGKPAETYKDIEDSLDYVDEFNQLLLSAGDKAPKGVQPATDFDVLTIRNRLFVKEVTLSTALDAVDKVHPYADIHCYFCRSFT